MDPESYPLVLKTANEHGTSAPETLELTCALCERIAKQNEYLTPAQVYEALLAGKTIHTNFCKYIMVQS